MSANLIASEINRFLASPEPEVLVISGKWGVGKTHWWRNCFMAAKEEGRIALTRYSYVSLFGQDSIQSIRRAVFENTESTRPSNEKRQTDWRSRMDQAKQMTAAGYRKLAKLRDFLPSEISDSLRLSDSIVFGTIQQQIVCIDDLERASDDVSKKDVLGLISQLKEQKNCKVILLLNQDRLGEDAATFRDHIEKVGDRIIEFSPTADEAAVAVLDVKNSLDAEILQHCVALSITNIRLILRIREEAKRLANALEGFDPRILASALKTLTVFVFSKFSADGPPSKFLQEHRGAAYQFARLSNQKPEDPREEDWHTMLDVLGFGSMDDLDKVIANGVEKGYFDQKTIRAIASQQQAALRLADRGASMSSAWSQYRESFDNNEAEVLDGMAAAFRESYTAVDPINAAGLARLFSELDRHAEGIELIKFYIANRNEPQGFWDLSDSMFRDEISDPEVLRLFQEKFDSFETQQSESFADRLVRIHKTRSYTRKDVAALLKMSPDDFYDLFKAERDLRLKRIVVAARLFRAAGPDKAEYRIFEAAEKALDQIASESKINAMRVKMHRNNT